MKKRQAKKVLKTFHVTTQRTGTVTRAARRIAKGGTNISIVWAAVWLQCNGLEHISVAAGWRNHLTSRWMGRDRVTHVSKYV
jgi:hypothetical protein